MSHERNTKERAPKGRGNFLKVRDGVWRGRVSIKTPGGRKWLSKTFYRENEREALRAYDDWRVQVEKQYSLSLSPNITVDELFNYWDENHCKYKIKHEEMDEDTGEWYRYIGKKIIKYLGHKKVTKLTIEDFQGFANALYKELIAGKIDTKYIREHIRLLGTILRFAHNRDKVNTERQQKYLKLIQYPGKSKKKDEIKKKLEAITGTSKLEPYELRAIERAAKGTNRILYIFIQIIKYTGMRRSEALGLKWNDATKDGIIVVRQLKKKKRGKFVFDDPKTVEGIRAIPMIRHLKEVLLKHKAEQELMKAEVGQDAWENPNHIITNEIGGYIDPRVMTKWFRKARKEADITKEEEISRLPEEEQRKKIELFKMKKITPHVVRHYYSSFLNHVGIDKKIIMSLLGHANMEFTDDTYIHLFSESVRQAAKVFEHAVDLFEGKKPEED